MTDVIDRACELEQKQREQAVAAAKAVIEKPRELDGHRYCLDCDVGLSTARLLAAPGAVRCIECQTELEREQRRIHQGRL